MSQDVANAETKGKFTTLNTQMRKKDFQPLNF